MVAADEAGYKNVNIIVGSDRQAEFENLATKYNGELYNFDNIRVISAGVRDADAEGVEGMSMIVSRLHKMIFLTVERKRSIIMMNINQKNHLRGLSFERILLCI